MPILKCETRSNTIRCSTKLSPAFPQVRAVLVVVADIFREEPFQVTLFERDHMIEHNSASPDEFIGECRKLGQPFKVLRCGEQWRSESLRESPVFRLIRPAENLEDSSGPSHRCLATPPGSSVGVPSLEPPCDLRRSASASSRWEFSCCPNSA
jgi:hypothetical protein